MRVAYFHIRTRLKHKKKGFFIEYTQLLGLKILNSKLIYLFINCCYKIVSNHSKYSYLSSIQNKVIYIKHVRFSFGFMTLYSIYNIHINIILLHRHD